MGHAYYCDMTPEQIQERAKAEGPPATAAGRAIAGSARPRATVLRFRVPEGTTVVRDQVRGDVEFDNATIEDFVLVRGNGTPVFILANVVDDVSMGITNVVRAEEHLPNTPQAADDLGGARPRAAGVGARAGAGERAAQEAVEAARQGGARAVPRRGLPRRRDGQLPDDARLVAGRAGDPAVVGMEAAFRLEDVNHAPAFFDLKKLAAFNGEYIRMLSVDELVAACDPWLPAEWDRAGSPRWRRTSSPGW
jgi:glutamyl-tRNA synthetase